MAFPNPTDAVTAAGVADRIPEIWSPMVQEELFAKTVAAAWFHDFSNEVASEGDVINISDVYTNSFTVQTQSTQANGVVDESPAQANVALAIDTHKYIAFIIGDKDAKQLLSSYDLNATYARKAAGALKDALEDSLLGLYSGLSQTQGAGGTVLLDEDLRGAMGTLDDNNLDLEDIAYFFNGFVYWNQVAGIQKLYDASMRAGNAASITVNGNFGPMESQSAHRGFIYGAPVFTSSNVVTASTDTNNLLAHRDTFGYANQTPVVGGGNACRVQADYQLRNLGTLSVVDIIYGVVEVRDEFGVRIVSDSTAVTS